MESDVITRRPKTKKMSKKWKKWKLWKKWKKWNLLSNSSKKLVKRQSALFSHPWSTYHRHDSFNYLTLIILDSDFSEIHWEYESKTLTSKFWEEMIRATYSNNLLKSKACSIHSGNERATDWSQTWGCCRKYNFDNAWERRIRRNETRLKPDLLITTT